MTKIPLLLLLALRFHAAPAVAAAQADGSQVIAPVRQQVEALLEADRAIRPNLPPPQGRPSAIPFFTIWRRDSPDGRWLSIAE